MGIQPIAHPDPMVVIPLNLELAFKEIINLYENETRQKKIEMKLISHDRNLRIFADKFLFERVIKNLITNAVEAMHQGGHLSITLTKDRFPQSANHEKSFVKIMIKDTGVGIPKERIDSIFVDYISTKRKGLGLGLALTKKNVSELGGTISVESKQGKGSIFTLTFPSSPSEKLSI